MTPTGTEMPHAIDRPQTPRKRFNCFVDDTALIAGLKKSTRDGIKKWVNNQSIQVFVPLHTLERLRYLAKQTDRPGRVSTDAQEAIQWLDEITSDSDNPASKLVRLEGGFERYETWAEVEKFLLPETLLSMEREQTAEVEPLTDSLADLRMDALPDNVSVSSQDSAGARTSSPISVYSSTSPGLLNATPFKESRAVQPIGHGRPNHKKSGSIVSASSVDQAVSKKTVVPKSLQPFYNHLMWRVNQDSETPDAIDAYILITNDAFKQQVGQRFGIRCKRLEQLREVIAREDRDLRNREQLLKKENAVYHPPATLKENSAPPADAKQHDDDDDDEIVFKRTPPKGPQSMNGNKQIFDPNTFGGRSALTNAPRGGRGGHRGNRGGSPAARASSSPRPTPITPARRQQPVDLSKPIDPDSFARPGSGNRTTRGGRRTLWEPT